MVAESRSISARIESLRPVLSDPEVIEISIDPAGRILVASEREQKNIDALPAHEARALTFELSPTNVNHPLLSAFELKTPGQGVLVLRRKARLERSLDELVDESFLGLEIAGLLKSAIERGISIFVVGARGMGRTSMLSALAQEAVRKRSCGFFGIEPPPALVDAEFPYLKLSSDALPFAFKESGLDTIVAKDLPLEALGEALLFPRQVLVSLEAETISDALRRITSGIVFHRPGVTVRAAEALIESGVGLFIELGRHEKKRALLALGEPRRASDRMSFRALAWRAASGDEKIEMENSLFSSRLRTSDDSQILARAAVQGQGGYAQDEEPEFQEPSEDVEAPVGKVGPRELSLIRPEQLVSKSFLVDVSGSGGEHDSKIFTHDQTDDMIEAHSRVPLERNATERGDGLVLEDPDQLKTRDIHDVIETSEVLPETVALDESAAALDLEFEPNQEQVQISDDSEVSMEEIDSNAAAEEDDAPRRKLRRRAPKPARS